MTDDLRDLLNTILAARTLEEIQVAQEAARRWVAAHEGEAHGRRLIQQASEQMANLENAIFVTRNRRRR